MPWNGRRIKAGRKAATALAMSHTVARGKLGIAVAPDPGDAF